ncbi:MAG: hypothetical protein QTN59_18660 [Candidatus Electrothrix communis]|nr:MAG: hypothetical protein QTN59_18660 [Candidatus Electrothrix communis]
MRVVKINLTAQVVISSVLLNLKMTFLLLLLMLTLTKNSLKLQGIPLRLTLKRKYRLAT